MRRGGFVGWLLALVFVLVTSAAWGAERDDKRTHWTTIVAKVDPAFLEQQNERAERVLEEHRLFVVVVSSFQFLDDARDKARVLAEAHLQASPVVIVVGNVTGSSSSRPRRGARRASTRPTTT